jgi:hypothetical protein
MFPPTPKYPRAIDSDYTLFLVRNTTESRLCKDNAAWALEIEIIPVEGDSEEIWPENGFANIEGELLYYDAVAKNSNGKVYKLRRCARNLGGEPTKFNSKGTWIRGFVVAEHHNQLVDAVLKTEDFIGFNFDPRQETLDWRIRNLQGLPIIFDDFDCPDVNFNFKITSDDPVTGKIATFLVGISPPGSFNSYRLDFGDGSFTTTDFQGTHRYAVNAVVDPVVTLVNDRCQIIQTPIERNEATEPPAQIEAAFDFPLPEFPAVPDFTFVPCSVPEPDINLPPLVVPCISIEGQLGPIPSIIEGPSFVSQIVITGPDNPVNILHSTVEIIGGPIIIPPVVLIDPPVPPTIIIDPPIPPTIVIVPPQSSIVLALDVTDLPRLEVDWGTPPDMEVALTFARPVKTPERFAADPALVNEFGNEFADLFEASTMMKVEYESVGIPSEIRIIPPDMPKIEVDVSKPIKVDASEVRIPDIKIHGPDAPIPTVIRLNADELPEEVPLVYRGDAIPVKVETEVVVKLESKGIIPERILLEIPTPIPEKIILESNLPNSIVLVGPTSIPLEIPENFGIPLLLPDKMPEIELVYRGSPIEVKVTMDQVMSKNDDNTPCVMLVPCNR